MFKTDLGNTVCKIVDMMLEKQDNDFRRNHALVVTLDCRLYYYDEAKHKETHGSMDIKALFNRPYGSHGSTHTFISTKGNEWKFLSSHDTCWKDAFDNALTTLYFDMANKVIAQTGKDLAPNDLDQFCGLSIFDPIKWEVVEISKDQKDEHGYKKIVKIL